MGAFVAQRLVKLLALADTPIKSARVGILGLTFKQDVPDLRNTKVVDIVRELKEFGVDPLLHDPLVTAAEAAREYGVRIKPWEELSGLDALIVAVPHREFLERPVEELLRPLRQGGVLVDLKSVIDASSARPDVKYWSL
jgi:UDP-N-acetyl-D-galactosamine dehydrogenase